MFVQDQPKISNSLLPVPILNPQPIQEAQWITIPASTIEFGLNDREADDNQSTPCVQFGWDNEKPKHSRTVPGFEILDRAITIEEYMRFLQLKNFDPELVPMNWLLSTNHWFVKTIYGLLPLGKVTDWPVYASNFQAMAYASHFGLKLPTEEQITSARAKSQLGTAHSFNSLTPIPSKGNLTDLVESGWELTSTVLEPYENYEQSQLYPGYTFDFFDGKHFVVLGGSWATVPRIAERKTFRNWYQCKYPYVFAKFRLVK